MNPAKKKKTKKVSISAEASKTADDLENECDEDDPSKLKPARPKIGESKDNLSQRSDWFQRRSGKK